MAFFDPSKPIIFSTEASFNEGLSAALLQKTDRGIQPVNFISRTMRVKLRKTLWQSNGPRRD